MQRMQRPRGLQAMQGTEEVGFMAEAARSSGEQRGLEQVAAAMGMMGHLGLPVNTERETERLE